MPRQSKDTVATLGIDIGKNTFHLVGLNKRHRSAPEALPPPTRSPACQPPSLPHRHGGLCRRPSLEPPAQSLRPRRPTHARQICKGFPQGQQKRLPRCGSHRRSGATPHHALRRHQDGRTTRPASLAPGALPHRLRVALPDILATRTDLLAPRLLHILNDLIGDWRRLDERIHAVSLEIQLLAQDDPACERLMTVPGIGPIISSATVAAIGTGDAFSKGRDFGAWLGLVPKQISTGDRTILGKISKRGNKYLRTLFVQAARVVLLRPATWERHGLQPWIAAAAQRLHHNVLAIALANKLARIAWSVLHHGRNFEVRKISEPTSQPA